MTLENMNAGPQPLDALMEARALKNHDLVAADIELNLTHKEVAKARKGRQLTARTQKRILAALNVCLKARDFPPAAMGEAFNYQGR
jgi:hypothetical protein